MPKKPILKQNSYISNNAPAQVSTSKKMPAKVSKGRKVLVQVSTSKKGQTFTNKKVSVQAPTSKKEQTSTSKEVSVQVPMGKKAPARVSTGKKVGKKEFLFKAHNNLSDKHEDSNNYEAPLSNSSEDT